ncbi:MAG: hypothetical protein JWO38_5001 [Gemmataceae bacterium]|nr:hypothetical protein [Gemmataceae bacterium]
MPDSPHECDLFQVSLDLVAGGSRRPFGDLRAIVAECWMESEGIEGLIGRDVLAHCNFLYMGRERAFTLAL